MSHLLETTSAGLCEIKTDVAGVLPVLGLGFLTDEEDNLVGVATRELCSIEARVSEALATKLGLVLACKLGYKRVELESDCEGIVKAIMKKENHNSYLGPVIQDISLASNFAFISFLMYIEGQLCGSFLS